MIETGKHIYGIISSNTNLFLGGPEISNVYTIPYKDISALVSDSKINDYSFMSKEIIAEMLLKQQKIIEKIMSLQCSVIPVKLGTFASTRHEIMNILIKDYALIKNTFNKIFNKIEIEIIALWSDFNSVIKEVGEQKEIKEFKLELLNKPDGITVNDNIRVGALIKSFLDKKREKYSVEIHKSLNNVSEDSKIHDTVNDSIVANLSFLIDKTGQIEFDSALEYLNNKFSGKLKFKYIGPLAPYSFYMLDLKNIQSEDIEWAKSKLGLNAFINKNTIKKAYQKMVFSFHPDQNGHKQGLEKEFNDITKAYKLLINSSNNNAGLVNVK